MKDLELVFNENLFLAMTIVSLRVKDARFLLEIIHLQASGS